MYMLDAKQKQNLKHLSNFIQSVDPINFDMGSFCQFGSNESEPDFGYFVDLFIEGNHNVHSCDSHMCLIGWAPSEPKLFNQLPDNHQSLSWRQVSSYLFGVHDDDCGIGSYLFSSSWGDDSETNTIEHALKRIDNVLEAETEEDLKALVASM